MITPEFEKEYYDKQIILMSKRYKNMFHLQKLNWNSFLKYVKSKLNDNSYRLWIFLCGLDSVLKDCATKKTKAEKMKLLNASSKIRIFKITKDDEEIDFFLKNI